MKKISYNIIKLKYLLIIFLILFGGTKNFSQPVPAIEENIPYLVTFGANADKSWGDDDFCQIFFCIVPSSHTDPVYIRVFDPDTGGSHDEKKGEYNTEVNFSVYGGKGCWSVLEAQGIDPVGNYKSGLQLGSRSFISESKLSISFTCKREFERRSPSTLSMYVLAS